jgi:hypothetical protein
MYIGIQTIIFHLHLKQLKLVFKDNSGFEVIWIGIGVEK